MPSDAYLARKQQDEDRSRLRRLAVVHAEIVKVLNDCSEALGHINRAGHGCYPYTGEATEVQRIVDDLIVSLTSKVTDDAE